MEAFRTWATAWGDSASVIGLGVSVLGFVLTIVAVLKSRSAATSAADAANRTKDLLVHSATIADFSAAVVIMQEIKRLHRAKAWPVLPDRYAMLREKLIGIRSSNPQMDESRMITIRKAEEKFADLERRVEKSLSDGTDPPNIGKFNDIVSAELDSLHEVLVSLKQETRN